MPVFEGPIEEITKQIEKDWSMTELGDRGVTGPGNERVLRRKRGQKSPFLKTYHVGQALKSTYCSKCW